MEQRQRCQSDQNCGFELTLRNECTFKPPKRESSGHSRAALE